jgi:hypothetical protein
MDEPRIACITEERRRLISIDLASKRWIHQTCHTPLEKPIVRQALVYHKRPFSIAFANQVFSSGLVNHSDLAFFIDDDESSAQVPNRPANLKNTIISQGIAKFFNS